MKYLITGGAGFIGSHLAHALVAQKHEVVVYDNLSSGNEHNLAPVRSSLQFIQADIRDCDALTAAMHRVDGVFHEAALVSVFASVDQPMLNHDINLTGTVNVLQAARSAGVRRVVMACTAAAYGNEPSLPKHEDMRPQPESPYALSKVAAEYYLRVFAQLYNLETVALRYFNVYGPRQDPNSMYSGVISKFTHVINSGGNPVVFGDGGQTRDFVFVSDIVRANLLAMQAPDLGHGEIINIGTGSEVSLLELLQVLRQLTGRHFQVQFQAARPGDVRHSVADISRAQHMLGYAPTTTIEVGLAQLLA